MKTKYPYLSFGLLLGLLLQLQTGWSQTNQPVLDALYDINFQEQDLASCLEELESKLQLDFVYGSNTLPQKAGKYTKQFRQTSLKDILRFLFANQAIELLAQNNRILIRKGKTSETSTLHGFIYDQSNGEALIGATIQVVGRERMGAATNAYGFFSLNLPKGHYNLQVSYLGYQDLSLEVNLQQNQKIELDLKTATNTLEAITIVGRRDESQFLETAIAQQKIEVQKFKHMPALGGEPDVLKILHLLPGVQSVGEGSTGLFVRGGDVDQNLVLLDEAPVYNPSHMLGFFSAFNADAIHDMEFHKGAFPAEFGGRLSSVVDIKMKEGNKEKLAFGGGIGLLMSRLQVEGPIKKGKSSFLFSGRRTYPDLFLKLSKDNGGNLVHFYDLNAKVNFELGPKDRLYFSSFFGNDRLRFFDQFENNWNNFTASLRWNRIFSPRLFANISLIRSRYHYDIENIISGESTLNWESGINSWLFKLRFNQYLSNQSQLNFGLQTNFKDFNPGQEATGTLEAVAPAKAMESALFIEHQWQLGQLAINYGLRLNIFHRFANGLQYYFDGEGALIDFSDQDNGLLFQENNWSPRLKLSYTLSPKASLQLGAARVYQYQHQLRNAVSAFSAFYIWMPSGPNIPVQAADQIDLAYKQQLGTAYQLSLSSYYKRLTNQIDFADHAQLFQNPLLEGEIRTGKGRSYGLELLLEKNKGKLQGNLSYTYSRAWRTIAGINQGREFPSFFDIPHSGQIFLQYQASSRIQLGLNWKYTSGNPVDLPIGSYQVDNRIIPIYGDRNSQRLDDFHRLDLSLTLHRRLKPGQKNRSYWHFSIYNVYFRKNALNLELSPRREPGTNRVVDPTEVVAYKTYVFGLVPSVSYNFKF